MKIEVNVTKKYFLSIIAVIVIVGAVIGVVAYASVPGNVPNPGHTLVSVQGYFSGDSNLGASLGKFCQSDGTNCVAGGNDGLYDYNTCATKAYNSQSNIDCSAGGVAIGDNNERAKVSGQGKLLCCQLRDSSKVDFEDTLASEDCGVDRVAIGIAPGYKHLCAKIENSALPPNSVCRLRNKDISSDAGKYVSDSARQSEFFNGMAYCVSS